MLRDRSARLIFFVMPNEQLLLDTRQNILENSNSPTGSVRLEIWQTIDSPKLYDCMIDGIEHHIHTFGDWFDWWEYQIRHDYLQPRDNYLSQARRSEPRLQYQAIYFQDQTKNWQLGRFFVHLTELPTPERDRLIQRFLTIFRLPDIQNVQSSQRYSLKLSIKQLFAPIYLYILENPFLEEIPAVEEFQRGILKLVGNLYFIGPKPSRLEAYSYEIAQNFPIPCGHAGQGESCLLCREVPEFLKDPFSRGLHVKWTVNDTNTIRHLDNLISSSIKYLHKYQKRDRVGWVREYDGDDGERLVDGHPILESVRMLHKCTPFTTSGSPSLYAKGISRWYKRSMERKRAMEVLRLDIDESLGTIM